MKKENAPLIIVIDDDISADHPLVSYLHKDYGSDSVYLFQEPDDGIAFIESHLERRLIVLLDVMFNSQPLGFDVFNNIIKKSSLVCFIVMTGNIEQTSKAQMRDLINGHAWYLVQKDKPAKEIMKLISDADTHMMMRVDSALESWILTHGADKADVPFMQTRDGRTYSLADILISIRTDENDAVGKKLVTDVIKLAIHLIANDKSPL